MRYKRLLLIFPILFLAVYFCAGIFYDAQYVTLTKPFIIPSFVVYALANNLNKFTLNYSLYIIFFYLNELLLLQWIDSTIMYRLALIASFFCYLTLINLGYKEIKNKNLYTFPKGFTLFILFINCIFLVIILYILITAINDRHLNIILIFNAIVAVILGVTAVLYLGKFTNKNSYYYFFGVFALIFNDIFAAIVTYFIDNNFLNTIDRLLHFASFFLIYLFVINDKKELKLFDKIDT